MSTKALVSVEEYLHTSFDGPDREYVRGEIVERNRGGSQHSWVQGWVFEPLRLESKHNGCKVRIELRGRTRETRF